MASTSVLLLQLLLVSQASASHFFGGTTTYYYKGKNPDGTFKVRDVTSCDAGPMIRVSHVTCPLTPMIPMIEHSEYERFSLLIIYIFVKHV